PNWVRAREESRARACARNLQEIEAAKDLWAMEHRHADDAAPSADELYGPGAYLRSVPDCPDGGTYTIGDLSTPPTCSHGGALPPPPPVSPGGTGERAPAVPAPRPASASTAPAPGAPLPVAAVFVGGLALLAAAGGVFLRPALSAWITREVRWWER